MFTFNEFLEKHNIAPDKVLLMRHTPQERILRRVFPQIAVERPDLYNAYQSVQPNQNVENNLRNAAYLASFIGVKPESAHFVGVYKQEGSTPVTVREYSQQPSFQELRDTYGMSEEALPRDCLQFRLESMSEFEKWRGKLLIEWSNAISWCRKADENPFKIRAILEDSAFEKIMPPWNELVLTWRELQTLPPVWEAALNEWRGIYLITDESDGKSYVGAAYGQNNLLGRWREYAQTGHGGNRDLRSRNYSKFRFSILQRVSPDMDPEDVINLESTWKKRLHTSEFGLNSN